MSKIKTFLLGKRLTEAERKEQREKAMADLLKASEGVDALYYSNNQLTYSIMLVVVCLISIVVLSLKAILSIIRYPSLAVYHQILKKPIIK